jgi:hypothetical protein
MHRVSADSRDAHARSLHRSNLLSEAAVPIELVPSILHLTPCSAPAAPGISCSTLSAFSHTARKTPNWTQRHASSTC